MAQGKRYGKEFRLGATRLVVEQGDTQAEAARRRGNCYDNAPTESFFGKLKTEWVHGEDYLTREQATQHVFNDRERSCNRQRKHAALSYLSPAAFEELFHQPSSQQAA